MVEQRTRQLTKVKKARTSYFTTATVDILEHSGSGEWDTLDDLDDCIPQSKPDIAKVCQDLQAA